MRAVVLVSLVCLAACSGETIMMRNAKTGERVGCGGEARKLLSHSAEKCAESYEQLGWERVKQE